MRRLLPPKLAMVARQVMIGMSDAEIGREMGLQTQTVKNYMQRLFLKSGSTNRVEFISIVLNDVKLLKAVYEL